MLKSKSSNCYSIIRKDISKATYDSNDFSNFLELSDSINHNKLYLKHGQKIKNYKKNQEGQINRGPSSKFPSIPQDRINKVGKFTDKLEGDKTYVDEELDSDENYNYEYAI
uniref:Uncharacterized protein n=1 Tax=Strongyloides venezuelensis TaxID=75913 RepID=A0A0K0FA94_STRVS